MMVLLPLRCSNCIGSGRRTPDVAPAVLSRSLALKEDQTMKRKRFTEQQIIGVLREHMTWVRRQLICAANTGSARRPFTTGRVSSAAWTSPRPATEAA